MTVDGISSDPPSVIEWHACLLYILYNCIRIYVWVILTLSTETLVIVDKFVFKLQFSICLFVSNRTWPRKRFIDAQNYNKLCPKFLIFENFWKCAKIYYKSAIFCFCFIKYNKQREDAPRQSDCSLSWKRRWTEAL